MKGAWGFALVIVAFLFIITAFATIEPFKETLDTARNGTSLNCKGTSGFNQTAFDEDSSNNINKLTRRSTCFATGLSMFYFVGTFVLAVVIWVFANWRKIAK